MRTALITVALVTTACGAIIGLDDVPPYASGQDPATMAAIAAFAQKYCQVYVGCQPGNFQYNFDTFEQCVDAVAAGQTGLAALQGSGSTAAAFQSCTAQLSTDQSYCPQFASTAFGYACSPHGQLASGATCDEDTQCATGFCSPVAGGCSVCSDPPPSGGACALDNKCGTGNACTARGVCEPTVTENDGCGEAQPCAGGLACVSNTCTALPETSGAACDTSTGCNTGKNYVCVQPSRLATPTCSTFTVSPPGGPCGRASDGTYQLCRRNATCDPTSLVCGPLPNVGDACATDSSGPHCLYPQVCVQGKCAPIAYGVCK